MSSRASSSVDVGMPAVNLAHPPGGLSGNEGERQADDPVELEVHPGIGAVTVRHEEVGRAENHEEAGPAEIEPGPGGIG